MFLFSLICLICPAADAQTSSRGSFCLNYENDFFAATDRYYTQGIDADLILASQKATHNSRNQQLQRLSFGGECVYTPQHTVRCSLDVVKVFFSIFTVS